MPTTFQEWVQVAQGLWMIITALAVPGLVWLFKTGRLMGRKEAQQTDMQRRASDKFENLTERINREVDVKVDKVMHDRLESRVASLEQKQELASARLSKEMGRITDRYESLREENFKLRERIIVIEERCLNFEHEQRPLSKRA